MYKKTLFLIVTLFLSLDIIAKPLNFKGLSKYTLDDIQSITSIDIYSNHIELTDIDKIIKDLSVSDLIYDLEFTEEKDNFLIKLIESDIVENIYINNNTWIEDELIKQNLVSQNNYLLNKKI